MWGNFNTSGVNKIPDNGSTLNDGGFLGPQVPASVVCDAFFAFSKTWFDAESFLYPDDRWDRQADPYVTSDSQYTAVRAALIAGTTNSAIDQFPGRNDSNQRSNGGVHNYPRFSEHWDAWSYTGSFIPLFNSTQAFAPWENTSAVIYKPPRRNWSFDSTFLDQKKLPPGTPFFQYVQSTGFRQNIYN
jgi:hypothetical protein